MDIVTVLTAATALLGIALVVCAVLLGASRRALARAQDRQEGMRADHDAAVERAARRREHALGETARKEEARREEEHRARLRHLDDRERDLDCREGELRRDREDHERRSRDLERLHTEAAHASESAARLRQETEKLTAEARRRLEDLAGLRADEARSALIDEIAEGARRDGLRLARTLVDDARREAEATARDIVVRAIESTPGRVAAETTVTVLELPGDEMKGRIIGREGRNIRAIEMATGVDLLVDDTPSAILLSSFDPVRRELARLSLQALVDDGRIHPARIEDVVEKTRRDMDEAADSEGEAAAFALELTDVHPRLLRRVGRLRHYTVEGQNVLVHCRETAHLAGFMAAAVGLEAPLARRSGLLHDVSRSEAPASAQPVATAADLASKLGEPQAVVEAIRSLAPAAGPRPALGAILAAARRVSISRPGARRYNVQVQLERLVAVEAVARSFPGVREAMAVKAGRELRVLLDEEGSSDDDLTLLAAEIARRIQAEIDFPGQIRISVIRETRAIEYAL